MSTEKIVEKFSTSRRVRKFFNLFLKRELSQKVLRDIVSLSKEELSVLYSSIYKKILLLYLKDKYNITSFTNSFRNTAFVTRKIPKDKKEMIENAELTYSFIKERKYDNLLEDDLVGNAFNVEAKVTYYYSFFSYEDKELKTLSDILRETTTSSNYYAMNYNLKFHPKKCDNQDYLVGIELETPYQYGEGTIEPLQWKDAYQILRLGFLSKYDKSIDPGIEFVSVPAKIRNIVSMFRKLRQFLSEKGFDKVFQYLENDDVTYCGLHINISKYGKISFDILNERKKELVETFDNETLKKYFGRGYTEYTRPDVEIHRHYSVFSATETRDTTVVEIRAPKMTYDIIKFEKILNNSILIYEYLFQKIEMKELLSRLQVVSS